MNTHPRPDPEIDRLAESIVADHNQHYHPGEDCPLENQAGACLVAFGPCGTGERDRFLNDWLRKARFVADGPADEPWPAWSTGECLAVALILGDVDMLQAMEYTAEEAMHRLRFDLGLNIETTRTVFDLMRVAHLNGADGRGGWTIIPDGQV